MLSALDIFLPFLQPEKLIKKLNMESGFEKLIIFFFSTKIYKTKR
jgi:hypothetical protein